MRLIVFLLLALGLQEILAKPILHCLVTKPVVTGGNNYGGSAAYHAVFDPSTGSYSNFVLTAFVERGASKARGAQFDPFTRTFIHTIYSPQSDPAYLYFGTIVGANVDTNVSIVPTSSFAVFGTNSYSASGSLVLMQDYSYSVHLTFWPRNGQNGEGFTEIAQLTMLGNTLNENYLGGVQRLQDDKFAYLTATDKYNVKYLSMSNPSAPPTLVGSFMCGNLSLDGLAYNDMTRQYIAIGFYPTSSSTTKYYIAYINGNTCNYVPTGLPQTGKFADWEYDIATNQVWAFFVDVSGNSVFYTLKASTGDVLETVFMPQGYTFVNFDIEYTDL